jgi:hypothetical protein
VRTRWGLLGLVGGAVLLTGCAAAPGPLTGLNAHVIECVDVALYSDISVGIVVTNAGEIPVTITDIDFADLDGVRLTGAWIADEDKVGAEYHGYGVGTFPPDVSYSPGWVDRVDAIGAVVPAHHETFLVVRLQTDGQTSASTPLLATGPRIGYGYDRHRFIATSDFVAGFAEDSQCEVEG